MSTWVHPKCGKTIRQRGNRTGHCGGCCQTFEGQAVFDAHQRISPEGTAICMDPAAVTYHGEPLRLVDGSWRGPAFDGARNIFEQESEDMK